jgi:FixJ family two-component response regulator
MNVDRSTLIAVVDDDPSVLKALLRLFRSSKFKVRGFASGEEFLTTLPFYRYDCLVLDLRMPGMSGIEVQQDREFIKAGISTIVITAHDEVDTRLKCLAAGAVGYLSKPFDDEVLLQAVMDAIKK